MKQAVILQIIVLCILGIVWSLIPLGVLPEWLQSYLVAIQCMLIAALAGVLYCLRAIYVNYGVNMAWNSYWNVWYLLRPVASAISGLVAYIFLKAGVIILEADTADGANSYGYFAFAFIAGYNVDNFLRRIEGVAKSTFSVEPSSAGRNDKNDN